MPDGGGPESPDAINGARLGPVCRIVKLMCGNDYEAHQVEALINSAIIEAHNMTKRLRHMPYWIQVLAREAESIAAEAYCHHMTVEDVIALRSERQGREEAERRHWNDRRVTERSCPPQD